MSYYALRLALLPGIVLHELAHYYFCRLVGAQVHEVCFFSFGYPAGYVIHTAPKRFRAHCVRSCWSERRHRRERNGLFGLLARLVANDSEGDHCAVH